MTQGFVPITIDSTDAEFDEALKYLNVAALLQGLADSYVRHHPDESEPIDFSHIDAEDGKDVAEI